MKYIKYIILVIILLLFLPSKNKAYDYVNPKNKTAIENFRTDIYHLRELYEELIVEDEEEKESNTCTTVGTIYKQCSGVTVSGHGTYSLEEYVAGVVANEFGGSASNDENRYEISKVNAIAARSFLLANDGCSKTVISSPSFQVFEPINKNDHNHQIYLKAAQDTAGIVIHKNNKIQTGYFVTVPVSQYITKANGNWTFHMLGDANDESTAYDYTMPESDIFRISDYTGGLIYPDENSGHHWGIPTVGAAYEVEKGKSTEEILKMFYGKDISLAKLDSTNSSNSSTAGSKTFTCEGTDDGLSVASSKGFKKRTTQPKSSNAHYFSNENSSYAGGYVGQCTWYAFGRANEILKNAKSKLKWSIATDAGQWYSDNKSKGKKGFKSTTDVNQPKPGAVIVWQDVNGVSSDCKGCGHVAVVESVNSDKTIDITEANIGSIKSSSNPYGWQYVSKLSLSEVSNRWGYKFKGYIYTIE